MPAFPGVTLQWIGCATFALRVRAYGERHERSRRGPGRLGRGGRFGPHSSNESFSPIYYGRLVFIAYFNAGVRAVDVRDPFHPTEAGFYIPSVTARTDKRCVEVPGGPPRCKVAIQTNNVDVDDRGYVYLADRADTGLHIVELTGSARAVANFSR